MSTNTTREADADGPEIIVGTCSCGMRKEKIKFKGSVFFHGEPDPICQKCGSTVEFVDSVAVCSCGNRMRKIEFGGEKSP